MNKELNEAAEKYANDYASFEFPKSVEEVFKDGAQWQAEQYNMNDGDYGVIISKGNEVNSLLIGALRFLNDEQRIALRDALIDRTPKAEQKQVVTEQEIHAAGLNAAIENGYIDDSYTSAFINGFKSALQHRMVIKTDGKAKWLKKDGNCEICK